MVSDWKRDYTWELACKTSLRISMAQMSIPIISFENITASRKILSYCYGHNETAASSNIMICSKHKKLIPQLMAMTYSFIERYSNLWPSSNEITLVFHGIQLAAKSTALVLLCLL